MAVVGGGYHFSSKLQTLPPAVQILNAGRSSINHHHGHRRRRRPPTPPIFISTNLSHVNPVQLRDLYSSCNHSCHRFPNVFPDGRVEPVDVAKLRIAISHSSVVVSVFASLPENLDGGGGGDWYRKMIPVTPFSGQLVGFGRAVSDDGLTASIYDVMVIPSLRGRGIGRMILQRIIRLLTNKGVYDIAALCSDEEMLKDHMRSMRSGSESLITSKLEFFKACGFGDDILGSTTMMYSRSGNDDDMVKSAGRKLLMVPPLRKS